MLTVTKEFGFDAAHSLPGHPGLCKNLHGHRWSLHVTVKGPVDLDDTGMVLDFSLLKSVVHYTVITKLDHQHLNKILSSTGFYFPYDNPTAERLIVWMAKEIQEGLLNLSAMHPGSNVQNVQLVKLRLYESPTNYVEWEREYDAE